MLELTETNYAEFETAEQYIGRMYQDMVSTYGGFGHNIDYEDVDFKRFFQCRTKTEAYQDLCRRVADGATIALACEIRNLLDDEQRSDALLILVSDWSALESLDDLTRDFLTQAVTTLRVPLRDLRFPWEKHAMGAKLEANFRELYLKKVIGSGVKDS